MSAQPKYANVLGVRIDALTLASAVDYIESALLAGSRGYICVTGVHGIMEAQRDPVLRGILNSSLLTTPDGMPAVWMSMLQGLALDRVYGPDLMLKICELSQQKGYTHFLCGGKTGVAPILKSALLRRFPGLQILGTFTPPFRALNAQEESALQDTVAALRPDFLWLGLSTPKQERFMAEYTGRLAARIMIGVGAAFDIHAGLLQDAPQWVKKAGLQWCHRLLQEPRRLWKRYALNNPAFIYAILLQCSGIRSYSIPPPVRPELMERPAMRAAT